MVTRDPLPAFPDTRRTLVARMTSEDPEHRRLGFEALVRGYWRAAYAHLRLRWRLEAADAEDLTQEFFAAAHVREFFREYDPSQTRFRTFLKLCLDRFAAKARRAEGRLKRGGGSIHLSLDFPGAEAALRVATDAGDEQAFDAEWLRSLFAAAIRQVEVECNAGGYQSRFAVFKAYDLAEGPRPTYRDLGQRLGLPVTQITNHLAWVRRRLRTQLLEQLRSISANDAEFREEARALFGEESG